MKDTATLVDRLLHGGTMGYRDEMQMRAEAAARIAELEAEVARLKALPPPT